VLWPIAGVVSLPNSRNQSLDVLRGIAVLMVIVDHYSLLIQSTSRLLETFGRGVDLFFVLSGFLISGLLFTEYKSVGNLNVWRFWIRRGFKIYPAFYVFLSIAGALGLMTGKELLHEGFFLQGYASHFWFHTWSLAVEEHFYFSLPLLLWLLMRVSRNHANPFRLLPKISILVSVLCCALRISAIHHAKQYGIATHLRMDALFAGVALGYFCHFDSKSFREAKSAWVLIIGIFIALLLFCMPFCYQMTFAYLASLLIVAWAANRTPHNGYMCIPFAFVGRHSYSIYLWHALVAVAMTDLSVRWFSFPAYAGTSIALGVLMSKAVELPALKIRDRLFPSIGSVAKGSRDDYLLATPKVHELSMS
jgi:peptidoglycan/LPS O-acetylase OafA/YrhL